MTTKMTITDQDWTITETTRTFEDTETPKVAKDAAETVYAWLVNNVSARLPGWSYDDGAFIGPARADALAVISGLVTEASDFAIECLDEIRAECAA